MDVLAFTSMSVDENAQKTAKIQRRAAKSTLTRLGKVLALLKENNRPASEVSDYLVKVKQAFDKIVLKHGEYTSLIVSDEDFETEEQWLEDCQNEFLKLDINAKCYIEKLCSKCSENTVEKSVRNPSGMIGIQSVDGVSNSKPESNNVTPPNVNDEASNFVDISSESSTNNQEISSNNLDAFVQNNVEQNSYQDVSQTEVKGEVENVSGLTACGFRIEKPKLP